MSDFPAGPQVPEPGSPVFKAPETDNRSNHPALDNTAVGTTARDWDQTPMTRWLVETTAEREGISQSEALRQIRNGCEDEGEYNKPRSENLDERHWQGAEDGAE